MNQENTSSLKSEYMAKIDAIVPASFNSDQKEIAKKIIQNCDESDLHNVFNLITQRVKTGFVFDQAPEINHDCVALVKEWEELNINTSVIASEARQSTNGQSQELFTTPTEHTLIIGENYDALKNLCATYIDKNGKGLIDVIYIDPPYNTESSKSDGNDYKDQVEATKFIYRDKFTRDGWLNMMNERLKLAKQLLSDKGVIFISIDDSEQAYLKVLCDEIFGEENFLCNFIRKTKTMTGDDGNGLNIQHEYLVTYSKKKEKIIFTGEEKIFNSYSNPDGDKRGDWTSGDPSAKSGGDTTYFPIKNPITGQIDYPPKGRYWAFSKETLENYITTGRIKFKDTITQKNRGFIFKRYKNELKSLNNVVNSLFLEVYDNNEYMNSVGTTELENLGIDFTYPKSSSFIRKILEYSSSPNSLILDFFAGSGTTGQAVMELNAEDGGKRKAILVTNNENSIGQKITRERLYRVINGKGSNGETISWKYSEKEPCLKNNSVRVFKIENHELTLQNLQKAEELKEAAKSEFKKLNPDYDITNDFDIYNELSSLNPYKK